MAPERSAAYRGSGPRGAFGGGSVAALLVLLCACDPSTEATRSFSVQDSAGIRIVTTVQSEWADRVELELPDPVLTVPGPGATTLLSSVSDARRLANGTIAVLDGQSGQLVVYGLEGEELFTFGGRGEGPGEFLQALSIHELPDGTIEIYDARLQRITSVNPDGSLAGVRDISEDLTGRPVGAWTLRDGSLLMWTTMPSGQDPRRSTSEAHVYNYAGALVRHSLADASIDTLAAGPASTVIRQIEGQLVWSHLFGARAVVSVAGGGHGVLFSTSTSHEIDVIPVRENPATPRRMRFRFPLADQPITVNELEARRDQARRDFSSEGAAFSNASSFLLDPDFQPRVRPAFRELLRAPDGSILIPLPILVADAGGS